MDYFIGRIEVEKKKYKVVDIEDGKETIGYANTIEEIKSLAKHWLDNVTEEAAIFYYPSSLGN